MIDRLGLSRSVTIVTERGAEVTELTDGIGADSACEAVGTEESMLQAIRSVRPGGMVGCVGVPHDVERTAIKVLLRP